MAETPHIFLLAGEPSGDRIGADLMQRLATRQGFAASGVGGPYMGEAGLASLYPMSDLSVMGFADVIKSLPRLLWRLRQTANAILRMQPDLVVLIDAQVFSELLARRLRKKGYDKPILLYVAPSVWAWKPERAPKLRGLYDEVLAVLPFEPAAMAALGGPRTSYVGHPALRRIAAPPAAAADAGLVALFPGSRSGEIRRHMPLMRSLADRLSDHPHVRGFIMPTLGALETELRDEVATWPVPVEVTADAARREEALAATQVAIVTAGTITLELALAGVPMVGTYVPDKRLMQHYEKAGRPLVALPNVILKERVVPEIAPDGEMAERLGDAVLELLENEPARQQQRNTFARLREVMEQGEEEIGRQDPADRVLAHLARGD